MSENGRRPSVYADELLLLARALDRQAEMEALIKRLYAQLEDTRILLRSALYELAATRGESNTTAFANRWYRERRVRL
jgi:hypothetical protein